MAQTEARHIAHSIAQDEALGTAERLGGLRRDLEKRLSACEDATRGGEAALGKRVEDCEAVLDTLGVRIEGCEAEAGRCDKQLALLTTQVPFLTTFLTIAFESTT